MDQTIVFSGRIRKGSSLEEVRDNFSRIFKLDDPRQLDRFFSGNPVVIRRGLSPDEARKYEQFLFKAGALCEIRAANKSDEVAAMPAARANAADRLPRARLPIKNARTYTAISAADHMPPVQGSQRRMLLSLLLLASLALLFDMQQMGVLPSDIGMLFHAAPSHATVDTDANADNGNRDQQMQLTLSRQAASAVASPERDAARRQLIDAAATPRDKDNLRRLYQAIDQSAANTTSH